MCAARTPNPASPAAASAAPRTGPPALGRGLFLATCLDVGSHPPSEQAPSQSHRAGVVPRCLSQGSHRGRPSGGPRWSNLCWIPGWGSRVAPGRNRAAVLAPQTLESSGVSWLNSRARPRRLASRRRPPQSWTAAS